MLQGRGAAPVVWDVDTRRLEATSERLGVHPASTLAELYPTEADYVAAVRRSNDRAVRRGFLLREDADLIEAWALESGIGD